MVVEGSLVNADELSEDAVETPSVWNPPLCCLLPLEFVEGCDTFFSEVESMGASIATFGFKALSDQIVCMSGSPTQQEDACLKLLRQLWREQYAADDEEEGLFVILVPSSIAGAIVGTKGQKVLALIKETGAQINVSREVLHGLSVQPVTIEGSLSRVASAVAGVNQIVQEFAGRGRLNASDFDFGKVECNSNSLNASEQLNVSSRRICSLDFLVDIVLAGQLIGKQGSRIIEMQQKTGAKITVLDNLQGARCGDRVVQVQGNTEEVRSLGIKAVLPAIANDAGSRTSLVMMLPVDAIGYVIGKGGQTIKDIMHRSGADVNLQDGQQVGRARLITISGAEDERLNAVLSIALKLDELHIRQASDGSSDVVGAQVPVASSQAHAFGSALFTSWPDNTSTSCLNSVNATLRQPMPIANDFSLEAPSVQFERPALQNRADGPLSTLAGLQRSPAEKALLAGIQASGVLDHRLTVRVPQHVVAELDDVSRRSGARFQILAEHGAKDPGHLFITVVGPRMATSLAMLYIQDILALQS